MLRERDSRGPTPTSPQPAKGNNGTVAAAASTPAGSPLTSPTPNSRRWPQPAPFRRGDASSSKPSSPLGQQLGRRADEWIVRDGSAADTAGSRTMPPTPSVSLPGSPAALDRDGALSPDHKPILAERFKTKMCRNFVETGVCPYEIRCMFAHGEHELRTKQMNMNDGLVTEEAIKTFQRAQAEKQRKAAKKSQKRQKSKENAAAAAVTGASKGPADNLLGTPSVPLPAGDAQGSTSNGRANSTDASSRSPGRSTSQPGSASGPTAVGAPPRHRQQQLEFEAEKARLQRSRGTPSAHSSPQVAGVTSPPRANETIEAPWVVTSDVDAGAANGGLGSRGGSTQFEKQSSQGSASTPEAKAATPRRSATTTTTATGPFGTVSAPAALGGGAVMTSNAFEALYTPRDQPVLPGGKSLGDGTDAAITPGSAPRPTPASSNASATFTHLFQPGMALLNLGPASTATTIANSSATTTARNASDDEEGDELLGLITALRASNVAAADAIL